MNSEQRLSDKRDELLIIPTLHVLLLSDGKYRITNKFIDGMRQFSMHWPGPVTVLLKQSHARDNNLDQTDVTNKDVPFNIELWPENRSSLLHRLKGARVVLATLSDEFLHLQHDCVMTLTPLVWITETSLLTRRQIVDAEIRNPLRRFKRKIIEGFREKEYRAAMTCAAGVQCNGTPTYEAYRMLNKNTLLFYDSRVRFDMLATKEDIGFRLRHMLEGSPLRLAFSGRLISIKGVNDLPLVADELRRLGVPFSIDIYGNGDQVSALNALIEKLSLNSQVHLGGVLDFETQLIPTVKNHVDLFVSCHRQGDPSCTYLETLSCGTPIAGYDNEAWLNLAKLSGAGWATPFDPLELASKIQMLHKDRTKLVEAAYAALDFASQHTFEKTMLARVRHLALCAEYASIT